MNSNLLTSFGNIDIYLFDQLLKGRFDDCKTVIDIGCGNGRNIVYFLKNGFRVAGIDMDPEAVNSVRQLSLELAPGNPLEQFVVAPAEAIPFPDGSFNLAICSAVFHFAQNERQFSQMLYEAWRILAPGGYFFCRLASDIGIETRVHPLGDGRHLLPDGSTRFLVNAQMLLRYTKELKGELYEPIKTTNVDNIRCMTTWCVQKQ